MSVFIQLPKKRRCSRKIMFLDPGRLIIYAILDFFVFWAGLDQLYPKTRKNPISIVAPK